MSGIRAKLCALSVHPNASTVLIPRTKCARAAAGGTCALKITAFSRIRFVAYRCAFCSQHRSGLFIGFAAFGLPAPSALQVLLDWRVSYFMYFHFVPRRLERLAAWRRPSGGGGLSTSLRNCPFQGRDCVLLRPFFASPPHATLCPQPRSSGAKRSAQSSVGRFLALEHISARKVKTSSRSAGQGSARPVFQIFVHSSVPTARCT